MDASQSAGQRVLAAIKACQDFDANKKFEEALTSILTPEQLAKHKEPNPKS
jgi:hypothetical protein